MECLGAVLEDMQALLNNLIDHRDMVPSGAPETGLSDALRETKAAMAGIDNFDAADWEVEFYRNATGKRVPTEVKDAVVGYFNATMKLIMASRKLR